MIRFIDLYSGPATRSDPCLGTPHLWGNGGKEGADIFAGGGEARMCDIVCVGEGVSEDGEGVCRLHTVECSDEAR